VSEPPIRFLLMFLSGPIHRLLRRAGR
jgi:hypothetical protein